MKTIKKTKSERWLFSVATKQEKYRGKFHFSYQWYYSPRNGYPVYYLGFHSYYFAAAIGFRTVP